MDHGTDLPCNGDPSSVGSLPDDREADNCGTAERIRINWISAPYGALISNISYLLFLFISSLDLFKLFATFSIMLPKWKQRKYVLVLLFLVLSLYDVTEREVWSMALSDNIKKLREEQNLTQQQLADKLYVSRQTVCRWENGSRCPDLITAKKLALELNVSMDDLISDEDVNDNQMNFKIWKSERIQNRIHLQELRKKLLNIIQIMGSVFMAVILLFRIQLERDIPVWLTIVFLCVAIPLILMNLLISKKLREM